MAVAKGKERITITIHKETKELLNTLISLHDEDLTYSNMVEIAIMVYAKLSAEKLEQLAKENENAKSKSNC